MALQLSYETAQGFTAPVAYARISYFSGTKETISLNVSIYKDAQARLDGRPSIGEVNVSFPLVDGAGMNDMYTALKSDVNFAGAVDA